MAKQVTFTVSIDADVLAQIVGAGKQATPAPKGRTLREYEGKFVFLNAKNHEKAHYSGEYLILRQAPNTLYGVKPVGGYSGHELKILPLLGDGGYEILDAREDWDAVEQFAGEIEQFAAEKDGPTRRWIESVYTGASEVARQVRQLLASR